MATNLFNAAKNASKKRKANNKPTVVIPELEKTIAEMQKLDIEIAELVAKRDQVYSTIAEASRLEMINMYNKDKKFPGTIVISGGKSAVQFITADRYKGIDEDRYTELVKRYGKEVAEENTVFFFNTAVLTKYMEHISDLISSSEKLSQEDKDNLLLSETSYNVAKGTIKNVFALKKVKDVTEVVDDIQPVFSIKSIQVED